MIIKNEDYYQTSDLTLSVTLSLEFPIESVDKTNVRKAIFKFHKTPALEKLVESYLREEVKISPQLFSSQLRIIKTRLYSIE